MFLWMLPMCALVPIVAVAGYAAEPVSLPVMLFENHGQAPADVRFVLQYQHLRALYRHDAVVFHDGVRSITMRFRSQSPSTQLFALEPVPGLANFLQGRDPAAWIRDVRLYSWLA